MAFQAGTNRDGFKAALMKAFMSAHKGGTSTPKGTTVPNDKMTAFNPDRRAPGLMPGGNQAFKIPTSNKGENVLDGRNHPAPAMMARGPVNHNNDPRRTGFQTAGHQADKIKLTGGSATNSNGLEPRGHQANKIKLPKGIAADTRSLRGR